MDAVTFCLLLCVPRYQLAQTPVSPHGAAGQQKQTPPLGAVAPFPGSSAVEEMSAVEACLPHIIRLDGDASCTSRESAFLTGIHTSVLIYLQGQRIRSPLPPYVFHDTN